MRRLALALLLLFALPSLAAAQFPTVPVGQWKAFTASSLADPTENSANAQTMFTYLGKYLNFYLNGNQTPKGVWAFSGLAFDSVRNKVISPGMGGHADYGGNEVYEFDIEGTQKWTMVKGPTFTTPSNTLIPNIAPGIPEFYTDTANTYGDGVNAKFPASRHSYGGLVYMPSVQRVWLGGGIWWEQTGSTTGAVWHYDPVNKKWEQQSQTVSAPNYGVWDSHLNRVLYHDSNRLFSYDPALADGSRVTALSADEGGWAGASNGQAALWDPKRRRYVMLGNHSGNISASTQGLRYYNLMPGVAVSGVSVVPTGTWRSLQFINCSVGATYDSVRDRYIIWVGDPADTGGTQALYSVHPDTFVTTTILGTGDIPPTGRDLDQNCNGMWNMHFFYYPPQDVYLLINNSTDQVFAFRNPDQARVVTLPLQSWKAYPYPSQGTINQKIYPSAGIKHTSGFADEKRQLVIIGAGDSQEIISGVNQNLDSSPRVGAFKLSTGAFSMVKPAIGSPNSEWQIDRPDNGVFVHINNNGAQAIDDLYTWIAGFSGSTQITSFNTVTLNSTSGAGSVCQLGAVAGKGAEFTLSAGDFIGTIVAEKSSSAAGSGTASIASGSQTLTFSLPQSFVVGDVLIVNQGTGNALVIASVISSTQYTTNKTFTQSDAVNQSFSIPAAWVTTNFYGYDGEGQTASVVFGSANPLTYRAFYEQVPFYRARVSARTSGSASCLMETGETLDGMTWTLGAGRPPDQHGKPLLRGYAAFFDPSASSSAGTGTWIASKNWVATYAGDSTTGGQGFYDYQSNRIFHLKGSDTVVGLNAATGVYDKSCPLGSAVTSGIGDIHRYDLAGDVYGRKGYFIAPYAGNVGKIVSVDLDTCAVAFVTGGTAPSTGGVDSGGFRTLADTSAQLKLAFDPVNRVIGFPGLIGYGGFVYEWFIFHVDAGTWETPTTVSADFPASGAPGQLTANNVIFDTNYNAFLVYGGSGGPGYALGAWRYAGGPTSGTPALVPSTSLTGKTNLSGKGRLQ
jgi:hypothetical protein